MKLWNIVSTITVSVVIAFTPSLFTEENCVPSVASNFQIALALSGVEIGHVRSQLSCHFSSKER